MRSVLVALVAVGLAIGVFVLWPNADDEDPPTTEAILTTTTTPGTPTTQPPPTTTTASESGSHVVETVEEAEEILRELWFGWFEGIYNQDEDRIREVVATEQMLNSAVDAFGQLSFAAPPGPNSMIFMDIQILKSTADCLAVWSKSTTDALSTNEARTGVDVIRRTLSGWAFATSWKFKSDLWEADCESQLLPLP